MQLPLWKCLMISACQSRPEHIPTLLESPTDLSAHGGRTRGGKREHIHRRNWRKHLPARKGNSCTMIVGLNNPTSIRKKNHKKVSVIGFLEEINKIVCMCLLFIGLRPSQPVNWRGQQTISLFSFNSWVTTDQSSNLMINSKNLHVYFLSLTITK